MCIINVRNFPHYKTTRIFLQHVLYLSEITTDDEIRQNYRIVMHALAANKYHDKVFVTQNCIDFKNELVIWNKI